MAPYDQSDRADHPATGKRQRSATAEIVFLLIDNFSHLAFSCAIEPLRIANRVAGQMLYHWRLASRDGVSAVCSNGAVTLVDMGLEPPGRIERLIVASGDAVQQASTPDVLAYLRRERAAGTPIGAICSGACVLASAGFLDGQAAAVHWEYHDVFAELFPRVRLVRGVFVADAKFITAAGGTASADLMLHLIAGALGISTRQLERLFRHHLGTSPKRFINQTRLTRARNLLVQTDQSITEVAVACGFTTPSTFSKVYRAHFGVSPVAQRSTLR